MNDLSQFTPEELVIIALILLAVALIGGLIGYLARNAAVKKKDDEIKAARQSEERLRAELASKQEELAALDQSDQAYRGEVRGHFEQTSELMSDLVQNYRRMYEHLAQGAGRLADMKDVEQIVAAPPPEAITQSSDEAVEVTPVPGPASDTSEFAEVSDDEAEFDHRSPTPDQPAR